MSDSRKVMIVGLDGLTFDLLDRWCEEGELPYFQRLLSEGVRADLRSTLPPLTGPAWSSFQTGVNPGKHGIYDWRSSETNTDGKEMVDSTNIKTKTIWDLFTQADLNVGVIGVPVTYPPKKIRGFMTTGLLTPNGAEDYVYPPNLKGDLEREVGRYVVAPTHAEMAVNTRSWISELGQSINNRRETASYLLNNQPWDVSMVYFMETDTVMHHLYHTVMEEDESAVSQFRSVQRPVLEIHKKVEAAVERLIEDVADDNTTVLLVSDHGFGPLEWIFNVNSWLLEKGYLSLKDDLGTKLKVFSQRFGLNQRNLYQLGNLLGPLGRGQKWDMNAFSNQLGKFFLSMEDIDWEETQAFSRGGVTGSIRLNIAGRDGSSGVPRHEVNRVRDSLIRDLYDLRSPYTDEKVVDKAYRKEEVYAGPYLTMAPDILFTTKGMRTDTGGMTVFKTLDPIIPAFAISGTHRMNGVFAANGPEIQKGTSLSEMGITDVAPTILALLGLDIPTYMDGEVRSDIFEESYRESLGLRYDDGEDMSPDQEDGGSGSSDDEALENRLKGLGYLA